MSSSPIPAESLQHERTNESDVVCEGSFSLNQETPNQTDPPPKSDSETISNPQPIPDPEENSREEEEVEEEDDEEGEEVDEGTEQETLSISSDMSLHVDPSLTEHHVSVSDATLTSPIGDPNTRRTGINKTKQGKGKGKGFKGKGKGKHYFKKQQAIEEKSQTLMKNLKPVPFIAHKLLDFEKHAKLLKKLGLWDFVHIDFDRDIRVDLIAELVATYKAKARCSYVNGCRILVNRADLARAFKLPWKKEKGNVGGGEMDSDWEALNDESIGFVVDFVSDWVLLHEDMWMMPNEVMEWLKVIKDGHPEKVDWAGLFWFMVEKELKQGVQLRDCYYASHLQHLIKSQREDAFLKEENEAISVEEFDAEAKEQEEREEREEQINEGENVSVGGAMDHPIEEGCVMGGPNTDLTLGQDGEKEEGTKDVEMTDVVEKSKEIDEERDEEEEEDQQREWLLHGKNDMGEHFMQRCENAGEFDSTFEDKKEEQEEEEVAEEDMDGEEEDEDKFHVFPNDDPLEGDGFTGNLLQAMETNQMAFGSQQMDSGPSFFNNEGKRVIEHDNHIPHHGLNESNKRLRINDSWEHKPLDMGMCLENIQQMTERARLFHEEKERALEQSNMNQQILLNELQKRDAVIEHLHKTRLEELQKKDGDIYRLERELYLMGSVLDGYRKALKETQKVFAEYREKAQLFEEATYKDVGQGGLMLTAAEIEKRERKREEDYKMNCLILEQKMKEAEEDYAAQFDVYVEKVNFLDKRLMGIEADAKEVIKLFGGRKIPQNDEDKVPEAEVATESPPIQENDEEKVPEVATESLPPQENDEKVCEDEDEDEDEDKDKESVVIPEDQEKVA